MSLSPLIFSAMPSPTDICNFALLHIGETSIISLTEDTDKTTRVCATAYPQARDEALMTAPWPCAKRQETLSRLSADPAFTWASAYQLPNDFLRLTVIASCNAWDQTEYFDRQGDKLMLKNGWFTDDEASTINIEYIHRLEDSTKFDPLLVECIAIILAMKIVRSLTGSDTKAAQLRQEYEQVILPRATSVNFSQLYSGKNHPIRKMLNSSFLRRSRL